MYHTTSRENRESILRDGLQRKHSRRWYRFSTDTEGHQGVWLQTQAPTAAELDISHADTWRVDVRDIRLQLDDTIETQEDVAGYDEGNRWWVTYDQDISPSRLKLLSTTPTKEASLDMGDEDAVMETVDLRELPKKTSRLLEPRNSEKTAAGSAQVTPDGKYKEFQLRLEYGSLPGSSVDDAVEVIATRNGTVVGTANFGFNSKRYFQGKVQTVKGLLPAGVEVKPRYRRQGLATAMYQFAEMKTGEKIQSWPENRSSEGNALWEQKERPFGH
jgi:GNAT superfamily N-acetyltransferase